VLSALDFFCHLPWPFVLLGTSFSFIFDLHLGLLASICIFVTLLLGPFVPQPFLGIQDVHGM